ncbi:hypothetical protein [Paenibacillus dendritiformis]|uniref:hypothetical protein n=1 Tax=Paenibacillus dendritiformis TaxID=130049 RepID=UPI00387E1CDB
MKSKISQFHIGVSAEAFAAAMFARCGYDVSVQYGANQPEYDLIVAKDQNMMKVSVKGSQDGGWGLTQSYIENADYHSAVDKWLLKHKAKTIFCLVQFKNTSINELPRIYLATPKEIAKRLKDSSKGRGETILYEYKEWTAQANGYGTIDRVPEEWLFSPSRIKQLIQESDDNYHVAGGSH